MEERFSRSPAEARLPGQAGEEPAAEVSLKAPGPPDEIRVTAEDLVMPSTAAELFLALFPLGDLLPGQEKGGATWNRWLRRFQRLGLAVRGRIRDTYK
jgi:hypothetical protein